MVSNILNKPELIFCTHQTLIILININHLFLHSYIVFKYSYLPQIIIFMKEGGMVCLLGNKKNTWNQFLLMVSQISRLDIIYHIQSCLPMCFSCSTNLLVNIPFSLPQQSSPVVLYPSSSRVICRRDSNNTASGTFRQDLSNHAKMPHLGQSHNG